jgi:hypothetical protein
MRTLVIKMLRSNANHHIIKPILEENHHPIIKNAVSEETQPVQKSYRIQPDIKEPFYKNSKALQFAHKNYLTYRAPKDRDLPSEALIKDEHSLAIFGDMADNMGADYQEMTKKLGFKEDVYLVSLITSKSDPSLLHFINTKTIVPGETHAAYFVMSEESLNKGLLSSGFAKQDSKSRGVPTAKREGLKAAYQKTLNEEGSQVVCRLDLADSFYNKNGKLTQKLQTPRLLQFIKSYKQKTGIDLSYSWRLFRDKGFYNFYQSMHIKNMDSAQAISTLMSSSDPLDLAVSVAETTSDLQFKNDLLEILPDYPQALLKEHARLADEASRLKYAERLDLKDRLLALSHDRNPSLKSKLMAELDNPLKKPEELITEVENSKKPDNFEFDRIWGED